MPVEFLPLAWSSPRAMNNRECKREHQGREQDSGDPQRQFFRNYSLIIGLSQKTEDDDVSGTRCHVAHMQKPTESLFTVYTIQAVDIGRFL